MDLYKFLTRLTLIQIYSWFVNGLCSEISRFIILDCRLPEFVVFFGCPACRYPDVSQLRFREELEETFRLLLFRVDQQIARTDSEDENSDSHLRSTIVGANISLSVIHHPSIQIHFISLHTIAHLIIYSLSLFHPR
jgi:hypothetical protein